MERLWKVDPQSPVPIYVQIREIIREEILSGDYGDKNYAINALAERFGVNRLTIRQAIDELIREGLMYTEKGKGTFASPPVVEHIDAKLNFFNEQPPEGKNSTQEIRKMEWVSSPPNVAKALKIAPGTSVLYIDRLKYVDQVPLAIEYRYIPAPWGHALTEEKIKKDALRHILSNEMGVKWQGLENEIASMLATWQEAKDLRIAKNSPLLVRHFVMYGENEQAIVLGSTYYRADRYRIRTPSPLR